MPRLLVDLYTGPQCKRADLEICRRPDGSLWLLGEGACGKVYKVGPCFYFFLSVRQSVRQSVRPSMRLSVCPLCQVVSAMLEPRE